MSRLNYDVVVVGGGVTGCAVARELSRYELNCCLMERAEDVCSGTSKANSAIVHAGYDAVPGSLKAKFNVQGNAMMGTLSKELDFEFQRNGSMVLCFAEEDRPGLDALYDKGVANGVPDLQIISGEEARAMEPNLSDQVVAALYAPTGGIVCPFGLTIALAENACDNGVEFKLNTEVLDIIYSDNLISLKDSILLFITGLIIVSSKSGAYVPICLMIIFIPKRKFLKIKRQIIFNLSLLIGWAGWYVWQSLSVTKSVVGGSYYIEWAHEKAYTISMIINNPLHSIYVMENTLWEYVDVWFMNLIGKNLGWFDVPLLNIIIFLFLLIFLLSIIKVEQSDINSNALFRGGLAVLCCLSVGLVIGGMWLGWTPQSDELIGGVQGRYFLPVLPMTICIFQNSLLSLKRCIDKEIMIILASLECVTLCNILLVVLK